MPNDRETNIYSFKNILKSLFFMCREFYLALKTQVLGGKLFSSEQSLQSNEQQLAAGRLAGSSVKDGN